MAETTENTPWREEDGWVADVPYVAADRWELDEDGRWTPMED